MSSEAPEFVLGSDGGIYGVEQEAATWEQEAAAWWPGCDASWEEMVACPAEPHTWQAQPQAPQVSEERLQRLSALGLSLDEALSLGLRKAEEDAAEAACCAHVPAGARVQLQRTSCLRARVSLF